MKKWTLALLTLCLLFIWTAAPAESDDTVPAPQSCTHGAFTFTCPAGWEPMEMGESLMAVNVDATAFLTVFSREYKEKDIDLSDEAQRASVFDALMNSFGCEESEDIGSDRRARGQLDGHDSVFYLAARGNDVLVMIYSVLEGDAPSADVIMPFVETITHP